MELGKPAAAAAALALVAAAAGCGSSKTPLTASELIARGNALCKQERASYAQIQAQPVGDAAEAAAETGKLADAAQHTLDGLRDLEPPAQLKSAYDAYLDAKQHALDLLQSGQDAASHQDSRQYAQLQNEVEKGAIARRRLAQKIGFSSCSKPESGRT